MDWTTGIQRAIDYIEENLDGELSCEEIARRAYSSPFEFQRTFGMLCGVTLGEYIRSRRLTLAGGELSGKGSKIKVTDVALKYGYDTPESFSRAFWKFYGVTPSQAKKYGACLRSFTRLSVKLILKGGSIMDYRIEKRPAFRIAEKVTKVSIDDEVNKNTIPEFWNKLHADGSVKALQTLAGRDGWIYGVCYGNIPAEAKEFEYSVAAEYDGTAVLPEGFRLGEIPAQTWAIFPCRGAMPEAIQQMWHRIYTEFFPASEYKPVCGVDLEKYSRGDMSLPDYKSEIWVAVERRI